MPYLNSERETILNFDYLTQRWYAWSSIPSHIRKLEQMGWKKVKASAENGVEIDAKFEAPKNAITFRNMMKPTYARRNAFLPKRAATGIKEE